MIPLKMYKKFPIQIRRQIIRIVYGHMGEEFQKEMIEPFHHNFDYEGGKWYQLLLSHCTYNKEKKQIVVTIRIPYEEK